MGRIGLGVRVSVSFQKNANLVGRLGSGPRLVDRIRSGVRVSASFRLRSEPRLVADRADVVLANRVD